MNSGKTKALRIGNVLFFIALIVINVLPINNNSVADVLYMYPNLFIPTSYTFIIWSFIYFLLFCFCVYQSMASDKPSVEPVADEKKETITGGERTLKVKVVARTAFWVDKIGLWFMISCVMNILWLLTWHYYQTGWSVIAILLYLVSLIVLYRKVYTAYEETKKDRWFISIPFSVYLGWYVIVVIENIAAWLTSVHWDGWGIPAMTWSCIAVGLGAIIGLVFKILHDRAALLAIMWGIAGIGYRQYFENNYYTATVITAIASLIILGVIFFIPGKRKFSSADVIDTHSPIV